MPKIRYVIKTRDNRYVYHSDYSANLADASLWDTKARAQKDIEEHEEDANSEFERVVKIEIDECGQRSEIEDDADLVLQYISNQRS